MAGVPENSGHCFYPVWLRCYWQPVKARLRPVAAGGNGVVVNAVAVVNCSEGLQSNVAVPVCVATPSTI